MGSLVPRTVAPRLGVLLLTAGLVLAGCRDSGAPPPPDPGAASNVAVTGDLSAPDVPADAPTVAFLGDSLAAGLHLARQEAFPAELQRRLARAGRPFHLVNAGVSGDTTAGGRERVDWVMRSEPDVVVIELGANDGLRGLSLDEVESNLRAIVARVRENGARALLLGMRLPPNYGPDYTAGFDGLYARVAEDLDVASVPFFMEGVAGIEGMNLPDGIHPTPEGHRRLAANVEDALAALLADIAASD